MKKELKNLIDTIKKKRGGSSDKMRRSEFHC